MIKNVIVKLFYYKNCIKYKKWIKINLSTQ